MAAPPDEVERLRNHLLGAVQRALRLCNEVALDFPADAASAVLAALLREQSDVPVVLLHAVEPGGSPAAARRAAKHLGLDLVERHVVETDVARARQELERLAIDPTPDLARFVLAAQEARLYGPRLVLAQGAPDVLGGAPGDPTASPERRAEAAVAKAYRLQLRYPFLDRGVVPYIARLLKAGDDPKRLLQELFERSRIPAEPAPPEPTHRA